MNKHCLAGGQRSLLPQRVVGGDESFWNRSSLGPIQPRGNFGEHPLVESHYLPKRSRRQPSVLTFLAQDADSQVFCYSNADIRKGEEAEEVFRFIAFWKRQYGSMPRHLVFDSKLTTYDGLDRLDAAGITFITLRRRSRFGSRRTIARSSTPPTQRTRFLESRIR